MVPLVLAPRCRAADAPLRDAHHLEHVALPFHRRELVHGMCGVAHGGAVRERIRWRSAQLEAQHQLLANRYERGGTIEIDASHSRTNRMRVSAIASRTAWTRNEGPSERDTGPSTIEQARRAGADGVRQGRRGSRLCRRSSSSAPSSIDVASAEPERDPRGCEQDLAQRVQLDARQVAKLSHSATYTPPLRELGEQAARAMTRGSEEASTRTRTCARPSSSQALFRRARLRTAGTFQAQPVASPRA